MRMRKSVSSLPRRHGGGHDGGKEGVYDQEDADEVSGLLLCVRDLLRDAVEDERRTAAAGKAVKGNKKSKAVCKAHQKNSKLHF